MRRTLRLLHLQNLFHKPREMVRDDSSAVAAHPGCSLNLDVVPVHAAARTGNLNPLAACSLNDLRVFWTYGKFHPNPPLCYYAVRRNLDSRPCALAEDESYSKRARSSKSEGSEPASVTVDPRSATEYCAHCDQRSTYEQSLPCETRQPVVTRRGEEPSTSILSRRCGGSVLLASPDHVESSLQTL